MNADEYESLPTNNVLTHMTAGAIAGVLEHCLMYPLDSVKTRMQSLRKADLVANRGIGQTLVRMVQTEGIFRPVRGMSAVVVGSGPAHALYFSCYEYMKESMMQKVHNPRYNTLIYGAAGCISTLVHDGAMNPAEVVKQRVQMYNSPYKSVMDCIIKVYRSEGLKAFYRSYTTQLTMNIPFQSIHFMSYEFMQSLLNEDGQYNPRAHMISGAIAGGVASAATTPLDVCKTLLNTQEIKTKVTGLSEAVHTVYRLGGTTGFFRGIQARVLYTMPATAICWSTYEFFKYLFKKQDEVTFIPTHFPETIESSWQPSSPAGITSSSSSSSSTTNSSKTELPQTNEKLALKPRELPAMSGAGLYGAVSFNTVHSKDNCTNLNGIHKGNSILDIKHT